MWVRVAKKNRTRALRDIRNSVLVRCDRWSPRCSKKRIFLLLALSLATDETFFSLIRFQPQFTSLHFCRNLISKIRSVCIYFGYESFFYLFRINQVFLRLIWLPMRLWGLRDVSNIRISVPWPHVTLSLADPKITRDSSVVERGFAALSHPQTARRLPSNVYIHNYQYVYRPIHKKQTGSSVLLNFSL